MSQTTSTAIPAPTYSAMVPPAGDLTLSARESLLIQHVKDSIDQAERGESQLNAEILAIEGMSTAKTRHLLNNLCSLPHTRYLEVGCWKGSTFISAQYHNQFSIDAAIGIDNWSELGGPFREFYENCTRLLPREGFEFYSKNCFKVDPASLTKEPITIYLYDGEHGAEAQEMAFVHFNQILDNSFIAIVDDWNWDQVREGTYQAFQKLNYQVLFDVFLPARYNQDKEQWWNGLYVAVIRKPQ